MKPGSKSFFNWHDSSAPPTREKSKYQAVIREEILPVAASF